MYKTDLDVTEDYNIVATLNGGCVFLHCEVVNPKKSVLKTVKDSFEVILQELFNTGLECVFALTPREGFIKFLGQPYEVLETLKENDTEYKVVVWELK